MTDPTRKGVPAVRSALAILEHLRMGRNEPRTLSQITRATSMNVSTCFNVLKTLEDGQMLSFDPRTKTYRLGLYLGELGQLVSGDREAVRLLLQEARLLSDHLGLGCFVMTFDQREEFVVLDKVESREPIRVTIDIGATFPAGGAVAAKAWFAWADPDTTLEIISRHGLPASTPSSIVDVSRFVHELRVTREQGYAVSLSEYYPDHNAVASAVFGHDGLPRFLLVVVGTVSQLPESQTELVGGEIAAAADRATTRIGGRRPQPLTA